MGFQKGSFISVAQVEAHRSTADTAVDKCTASGCDRFLLEPIDYADQSLCSLEIIQYRLTFTKETHYITSNGLALYRIQIHAPN